MEKGIPFPVPERLYFSMSSERCRALQTHHDSYADIQSYLSASSSPFSCLDIMLRALEIELGYLNCLSNGVNESLGAGLVSNDTAETELERITRRSNKASEDVFLIKNQHVLIGEDIEDKLNAWRKSNFPSVGNALHEEAFVGRLLPRIIEAAIKAAKSRRAPLNPKWFGKQTRSYYDVAFYFSKDTSWCHVLGLPIPYNEVKVSYLVPGFLSQDAAAHLFGVNEVVPSDPQNSNKLLFWLIWRLLTRYFIALLLCNAVEALLVQGVIAIVPSPGRMPCPTSWRCVVLEEDQMEKTVHASDGGDVIKDLHNRELKFLSHTRPRARNLYLRFMISYIQAQGLNRTDAVDKLEAEQFWAFGGRYLNLACLLTLAERVSGCHIPFELVVDNTFAFSVNARRDREAGVILGDEIENAISAKIDASRAD
ncbi:unnamed protein product [Penicillium bialowiezense]